MNKIYNFSAGPAVLPESVLKQAAAAVVDYNGDGLSILEMSHRSAPIVEMVEETRQLICDTLGVPDNYTILFLQGGASLQFSMIPMNILKEDETADYTDTGAWSAKAIKEAQRFGNVHVISSSKETVYNHIPKDYNQSDTQVYLHITSNNTIYGTQWHEFPKANGFLVADMSSDIFSRSFDINEFGVLYAGAQKNMGPAGVTMVIIRKDLIGRAKRDVPSMLDFAIHADKDSMFNTPPVFAIYVVNRTLHWLQELGGVEAMHEQNKAKAKLLYDEIEKNPRFKSPIAEEDRSLMNVPFVFADGGDEAHFLDFCAKRGLVTLKGHRSVGGFRASIYNAMPKEGVETLVKAMRDYS
ncbi:MAG: 3-phosphoserine/phosphohydroxythreonine transaminase [Candidatus Marinimicrobia bacterium]|jgi:phosphoserine aminotransferase|nr:3-phosphoserine/phosphohydroxythreonine transaminase [Candidatus Neomarinimicrobiota bacterium]MDP7217222.1 3-phosphoserine/phosphohydroxythreonine transaminase [Candidatus Neomarinimicrobiota bacterium]